MGLAKAMVMRRAAMAEKRGADFMVIRSFNRIRIRIDDVVDCQRRNQIWGFGRR